MHNTNSATFAANWKEKFWKEGNLGSTWKYEKKKKWMFAQPTWPMGSKKLRR
jgi:hypothetical protein